MAIITEIRRKLPTRRKGDTEEVSPEARIHQIPVEDIIPNRSQPRSTFNQNAIARLADSIRRYGVLQPLTVRKVLLPTESPGQTAAVYELVAGERRLRAAKQAEFVTVPCIILNTDDATSAELAIVENLLREELNMFEQAEAFQRLINEFHLTQEEAARRVSMSQSAVANKLRILRLTSEERQRILAAGLTERHARALLKLSDPTLRSQVLTQILERRMNVSATEAYIEQLSCEIARYQLKSQEVTPEPPAFAQLSQQPITETVSEARAEGDTDITELPGEIKSMISGRRPRFKGSIRDMQLFYNSVRNAVSILETAGIVSDIQKQEGESRVVLTITLSRPEGA